MTTSDLWVQESFDGLSSLKQLMIDRNRVEEIQPGAFSQLGFLNLLSLTHNQLVYIPNMAFQVHRQHPSAHSFWKKSRWLKMLVVLPGLAEHQVASS